VIRDHPSLFGKKRYILVSALTAEQCRERLRAAMGLESSIALASYHGPVGGSLIGNTFVLVTARGRLNPCATQALGRLVAAPGGTGIWLELRVQPIIAVIILMVLGLAVGGTWLSAMHQLAAQTPGEEWTIVRNAVLSFAFPVGMMAGCARLHSLAPEEGTILLRFLRMTLAAEEYHGKQSQGTQTAGRLPR
jgi:hypothetical protein